MLQIFLSYPQLLIMNISFASIVKYVSIRGVSVAVKEIYVYMDTHLSSRWVCASAMARIP